MKDRLIIFSLYYGSENVLLAHSKSWADELSKKFNFTEVFAYSVDTCLNPYPNKLKVNALSNFGRFKKFFVLYKIFKFLFSAIKQDREETIIFYHMFPQVGAILGPWLRILGFRQFLWYSHSSKSLSLRICHFFINGVFTPTENSYPMKDSNKVMVTGHAVQSRHYSENRERDDSRRIRKVVYLGRVSRIKNLEHLILSIADQEEYPREIDIFGPILDLPYKEELVSLSKLNGVQLEFHKEIASGSVEDLLIKYDFFYSGNPNTLDKAVVQAAMSGCFILSEELHIIKAIGMDKVWRLEGVEETLSLSNQLRSLDLLDPAVKLDYRILISKVALAKHDFESTIMKISSTMAE